MMPPRRAAISQLGRAVFLGKAKKMVPRFWKLEKMEARMSGRFLRGLLVLFSLVVALIFGGFGFKESPKVQSASCNVWQLT